MDQISTIQPPFVAGSPIIVAGPTGSGKTKWVQKCLKQNLFTQTAQSVLYCYGVKQKLFENFGIPNLDFYEGLPSRDMIEEMNDGNFHILVLDDMMESIVRSTEIQDLFTKHCHHYNITVIFITQNLFAQGKCARNITLNAHYIVLFGNKRDESQALCLGRQLFPYKSHFFQEVYEECTSSTHGYLLVDCDPKSPRELKLRTNIFRNEQCVVFLPN